MVKVTQPNGKILHAIYMAEDKPIDWSALDPNDPTPRVPIPEEVNEFLARHFGRLFAAEYEARGRMVQKMRDCEPAQVVFLGEKLAQDLSSCCIGESRSMSGGCTNCGDPCL